MYKHKNNTNTEKRYILIISIAVAVILALVTLYLVFMAEPPAEKNAPVQSGAGEATVKQDLDTTQDTNQMPPSDDPKINATTSNQDEELLAEDGVKKNTDVIITDASQYDDEIEVRAFMPSIVESGTCTVAFKKGSEEFKVDEAAYADATTTICTNSLIKRDMFSSNGNWTVTVSYSSENYSGISEERTVEIQ